MASASIPSVNSTRRRRLSTGRREALAGYGFILPAILVLATFLVVPILYSLILVFMRYNFLQPPEWAGLVNVKRLFSDKRLLTIYRNSALIAAGVLAVHNITGLLLAMAVNQKMPKLLTYLYRTSLFFPVLTTTSSLAMVWRYILTKDRGIMNWLLAQIGIEPIAFLGDSRWAIGSIILYSMWRGSGYFMVLYLAGLQGIPQHLYEAAKIDGANGWRLTRHITLPLITPTAFFCLIMSSIGAFQMFDNAYVLTEGGPGDASRTIALYIYEIAFQQYDVGYAVAVALSLFAVLAVLTRIQFWVGNKWVYYD